MLPDLLCQAAMSYDTVEVRERWTLGLSSLLHSRRGLHVQSVDNNITVRALV